MQGLAVKLLFLHCFIYGFKQYLNSQNLLPLSLLCLQLAMKHQKEMEQLQKNQREQLEKLEKFNEQVQY